MENIYTFIPLIILIALMYLILIRPQRKKDKELKEMRAAVKAGDDIITIGGIVGKVVRTGEESLIIQVGAERTKLEVMRWAVSSVTNDKDAKAQKAKEKAKEKANAPEPAEEEEAPKKITPKRLGRKVEAAEEAVAEVADTAADAVNAVEEAAADVVDEAAGVVEKAAE